MRLDRRLLLTSCYLLAIALRLLSYVSLYLSLYVCVCLVVNGQVSLLLLLPTSEPRDATTYVQADYDIDWWMTSVMEGVG